MDRQGHRKSMQAHRNYRDGRTDRGTETERGRHTRITEMEARTDKGTETERGRHTGADRDGWIDRHMHRGTGRRTVMNIGEKDGQTDRDGRQTNRNTDRD